MEYGSDYSIDPKSLVPAKDTVSDFLNEYYMLFFDSGRSGIRYLLSSIPHETIAFPNYLCDSILSAFSNVKSIFYPIDEHLAIKRLDMVPWDRIDVFYLLHYFGCVQPEETLDYIAHKKEQYRFIIIEDTTHSIFSQPMTIGDYCICSLRKWFPIPDGGVLYSKHPLPDLAYDALPVAVSDRINGMVLKSLYLQGKLDCKPLFREILLNSEELLDKQEEIRRLTPVSEMILKCSSIETMTKRRKENYSILHKLLEDILPEPVTRDVQSQTPFTYVISIDERNALRDYLIQNKIYCAVHWPCPAELASVSQRLSDHLMSIPIDQRYDGKDMHAIARVIRGYFNE